MKEMEVKLSTNATWSEPTEYMINRGAKLALHKKEIVIKDSDCLSIALYYRDFWVMNDDTQEELKGGALCIDIPHELRTEFIEAIKNLVD